MDQRGLCRLRDGGLRHQLDRDRALRRSVCPISVNRSVRVAAKDTDGLQRLIQCFLHCPFSQVRMIEVTGEGKVIYNSEAPGEGNLLRKLWLLAEALFHSGFEGLFPRLNASRR